MNNIFYMLLDDKLYACGSDNSYYIAEFTNGKWERTIPLPMISYDVRRRLTEEEAMILTSNVSVCELFVLLLFIDISRFVACGKKKCLVMQMGI